MRALPDVTAVTAGMRPWPSRLVQLWQFAYRRAGDRAFWNVQIAVIAVTVGHYAMELTDGSDRFEHLHHLPPVLYAFPVIYASVRFGREGGILTGLLSVLLTLPNVVLSHQGSLEWVVEVAQIATAMTIGVVLSTRVGREATERRRAEEIAARLALANHQIMRAQEAERLRIARELHDETAQALVLLGHQLDGVAATAGLPASARQALYDIRAVADATLAGVRQFSRGLRPSILDDVGLVAALDWLTEDLTERAGVTARLDLSGAPRRLPPETELVLFRIAQESLRNAEKHAGATEMTITMAFSDEGVELTVTDNGSGFDLSRSPDQFIHTGQLGIAGMFERAQLVGGQLTIDTAPGRGTRVTATVAR